MDFECFPRLVWALPWSFSDALGGCEFAQGDVLYDAQEAYSLSWSDAQKKANYCIQVKEVNSPLGSTGGATFERNWGSMITLDLFHMGILGFEKSIQSTQGRLYSMLWRGNMDLHPLDAPEPEIPALWGEVTKRLKEAQPAVRRKFPSSSLFLIPFDPANKTARTKYDSVRIALRRDFQVSIHERTPEETEMRSAGKIAPTVGIIVFAIESDDSGKIRESLVGALRSGAAKGGGFKLERHSLLIPEGDMAK